MLHRLMPESGFAVHCTVQWEDGFGFKRKYVSYVLTTMASSRRTNDKGVSLVLKCQGRSDSMGQRNDL